ncbi:MAG: hypothetical protein DRR42_19545 [Gammaproteobacteria bacterium]|nr:MAG: hypothetical protein DRR42_19545 [Gammaproteobacteria bacterium]
MNDAELLITYSEISVGFAGFASIVVLFRRRSTGNWEPTDAFRFGAMLRASLLPALFSLVPLPLIRLGISDAHVWQFTSLLIASYMVWGGAKLALLKVALVPWTRGTLILFHAVVLFTQFVNLFGIGSSPQSGWVLLGLVGCLGLAGWHFYHLVWDPSEDAAAS